MRIRIMALVALLGCSSSADEVDPHGQDGGAPGKGGDGADGGPRLPDGPRLIPGPGEDGFDAALADKARAYDRQFHTFSAPWGLSLDALIPDAAERDLVSGFLAQDDTDDFAAFAGRSPLEVVSAFDEHGDLGMFGGAAAAGEAFRYMALRDDASRADLLDAIAAFHIAATITGVPGTVARGIRRTDEPGVMPPVEPPPASCPDAGDRSDRWRPDGSGEHDGWIYDDNNSKDQLIGYVFALGAFWDAIAADPSIDDGVRAQLQADARALATSLMEPVQVGFGQTVDLVIRDWHECPTRHLDLNPRIVPIGGSPPLVLSGDADDQNGWNALAALGVVRTLYHITGDEAVRAYYVDELVGARDFPRLMVTGPAHVGAMYQDGAFDTNFSNVNMAFVSAWGLLRYETDPDLRARYREIFASELWDRGHPHDGASLQQAFFNLVRSGLTGDDPATTAAAAAQLGEFAAPPYWDVRVDNCDADEIAAGSCVALDGTTEITLVEPGSDLSVTPLTKRLRPPSNFEWRSDPRSVNGGGGVRLNPGGDFRSAYWMGRALLADPDPDANLSPFAR
jgi:hypothetical protein